MEKVDFDRVEMLLDSIALLKKNMQELSKEASKKEHADITMWQFRLLLLISRNVDMNQKELAHMIHISAATLSVGIQNLVSLQYISRVQDSSDKRNYILNITDLGKQKVEKGKKMVEFQMLKTFHNFSYQELAELMAYIKRIDSNISKIKEEIKCID